MDINQKTIGAWMRSQRPREFRGPSAAITESTQPVVQRTVRRPLEAAPLIRPINPTDLLTNQ